MMHESGNRMLFFTDAIKFRISGVSWARDFAPFTVTAVRLQLYTRRLGLRARLTTIHELFFIIQECVWDRGTGRGRCR